MNFNLLKLFLLCLFTFSATISFVAQEQYIISKDRDQLSLKVEQQTTKFTVSDILEEKKGKPLPESKVYSINIKMDTIGNWTKSQQENVWKLNINVPDAKEFFISFSDFYLPVGSKLYAYNINTPKNAIVFQHGDNPNGGAYSLENLKGDNVLLEYVAPSSEMDKPRIHFLRVGYKYIDNQGEALSGFNSSGNSCMINVNCPQGEDWQAQKKGVMQLRMLKSDGRTYLCTGTLINNTGNDKTPYVLTADHCFENMSKSEIEQTEFFFEYESPTCEKNVLPTYKYHKGSELLILNPINSGSDGALLKLSDAIPDDWDVYFNGWDRINQLTSTTGSTIHHPLGDVKKITLYDQSPVSGKWNETATKETHWVVRYSLGVTRGGSSGCPLFNYNGLVIGTLTGGESSCQKPTYADLFGKFWYHWNQHPNEGLHMNKYLDPLNTGAEKLLGLYNNENAVKEIQLEKYDVDVMSDMSLAIKIFDGNGGYSVTSSNNDVASAVVTNDIIDIKTNKIGSTIIKVKDKKEKTKDINISVHKHIDFVLEENKTLNVSIYKEDDSINQVTIIDLDGNTLYKATSLNEEKKHSINMEAFRKGLYIVQVKTKSGTTRSEKFVW